MSAGVPYEQVLTGVADGILVLDRHGQLLLATEAAQVLLGLDRRQLAGDAPLPEGWRAVDWQGSPVAFEDLPPWAALRSAGPVRGAVIGLDVPEGEGAPQPVEDPADGPDRVPGGRRWVRFDVELLWADEAPGTASHGAERGVDGDWTGVVVTCQDVTGARGARRALRTLRRLTTELAEAAPRDPEAALARVLEHVGTVCEAERVLHVELDRPAGEARLVAEWVQGGPPWPFDLSVAIDVLAPLLRQLAGRTPAIITDAAERFAREVAVLDIDQWLAHSALAVPIQSDDLLEGFLVVAWAVRGRPPRYLVNFLQAVADLLAAFGARARSTGASGRAVGKASGGLTPPAEDHVELGVAEVEELRQAAHRADLFADVFPDVLIEIDTEGRLVDYFSPASIDSVELDACRGLPVLDLFAGEEREGLAEVLRRVTDEGGMEGFQFEWTAAEGSLRFEARFTRRADGSILAVVREVSALGESTGTAREHWAVLARANEELQRLVQERDGFLAGVSHELRTPLNGILGLTEVLLHDDSGSLTTDQRSSLRSIEDSGRHLLELVNDLLDLTQLRTRVSSLDLRDLALDEVGRHAVDLVRPRAERRGLRIEVIDAAPGLHVVGDDRRLRQIVINLLDNAVKFTDPGGSVGVHLWQPDVDHAAISVWDTGMGIAEEDWQRIFEPFTQLEQGRDRQPSGSGLGLSLVERLVALHGGRVEVDSDLGRGSRFTIVLPLAGPA